MATLPFFPNTKKPPRNGAVSLIKPYEKSKLFLNRELQLFGMFFSKFEEFFLCHAANVTFPIFIYCITLYENHMIRKFFHVVNVRAFHLGIERVRDFDSLICHNIMLQGQIMTYLNTKKGY